MIPPSGAQDDLLTHTRLIFFSGTVIYTSQTNAIITTPKGELSENFQYLDPILKRTAKLSWEMPDFPIIAGTRHTGMARKDS
jgi:hypothetical protein